MIIITEISLRNFNFWGEGESTREYLTDEGIDRIESILEVSSSDSIGMTAEDINDFFLV